MCECDKIPIVRAEIAGEKAAAAAPRQPPKKTHRRGAPRTFPRRFTAFALSTIVVTPSIVAWSMVVAPTFIVAWSIIVAPNFTVAWSIIVSCGVFGLELLACVTPTTRASLSASRSICGKDASRIWMEKTGSSEVDESEAVETTGPPPHVLFGAIIFAGRAKSSKVSGSTWGGDDECRVMNGVPDNLVRTTHRFFHP